MRNPVSRAVSAFDMEHIDNNNNPTRSGEPGSNNKTVSKKKFWKDMLYYHCGFQTAQDLADVLEYDTTTTTTTNTNASSSANYVIQVPDYSSNTNNNGGVEIDCRDFGRDNLIGIGNESHLFQNYARYAAVTINNFPEKEIFVLRTEELWKDVIQTNRLLLLAAEKQAKEDGSNGGSGNENEKVSWLLNYSNDHNFDDGDCNSNGNGNNDNDNDNDNDDSNNKLISLFSTEAAFNSKNISNHRMTHGSETTR